MLRLADNLLATNQEKTFLMQDLIIDAADDAYSGKNDKCIGLFEFHPHKNDNEYQGIWR